MDACLPPEGNNFIRAFLAGTAAALRQAAAELGKEMSALCRDYYQPAPEPAKP